MTARLNQRIYILFVLLFCFSSTSAMADSAKYAQIVKVFNGVKIVRADGAVKIAQVGDKLFVNDQVQTLDRGFATIKFGDYGAIELDANSTWMAGKYEESTQGVADLGSSLEFGKLKAKINALKKDSIFKINTPTSVASVRGTEFVLQVYAMQEQIYTQIHVTQGLVLFTSLTRDFEHRLGPGESALSEPIPQVENFTRESLNMPGAIVEGSTDSSLATVTTGVDRKKSDDLELQISMGKDGEAESEKPEASASIVKKSFNY